MSITSIANTMAALELATSLLTRVSTVRLKIQKAQTEGRDLTKEELEEVFNEDDAARTRLVNAIAAAGG